MLDTVITPPPPIPSGLVRRGSTNDYRHKLTSDRTSSNKGIHRGSNTAEQRTKTK